MCPRTWWADLPVPCPRQPRWGLPHSAHTRHPPPARPPLFPAPEDSSHEPASLQKQPLGECGFLLWTPRSDKPRKWGSPGESDRSQEAGWDRAGLWLLRAPSPLVRDGQVGRQEMPRPLPHVAAPVAATHAVSCSTDKPGAAGPSRKESVGGRVLPGTQTRLRCVFPLIMRKEAGKQHANIFDSGKIFKTHEARESRPRRRLSRKRS